MMSENPENRMPLSHPARSVDAAPPDLAFERAFGGRVRPSPPRDGREDLDADAEPAPVADVVARAGSAGFDAFAGAAFADPVDAAEPFAVDLAAASGFDVPGAAPGRPGTAGRRATPDERGGRGASGCIAPPHRPGKGERGRPHGRPRHDLSLLRP
jgi:hypothetical protein